MRKVVTANKFRLPLTAFTVTITARVCRSTHRSFCVQASGQHKRKKRKK